MSKDDIPVIRNRGTIGELGLDDDLVRRHIADLVRKGGMLVWTEPWRDLATIGPDDVLPVRVKVKRERSTAQEGFSWETVVRH